MSEISNLNNNKLNDSNLNNNKLNDSNLNDSNLNNGNLNNGNLNNGNKKLVDKTKKYIVYNDVDWSKLKFFYQNL